jgi:type IV secretory pathway TrbF-like protein
MRTLAESKPVPEITAYTKYYEHDGMLRAYANRAMFLAVLFGVIACGSLGFAIYVRIQPPTIIRVDKDGDATVVGARTAPDPASKLELMLSASTTTADAASERPRYGDFSSTTCRTHPIPSRVTLPSHST